MKQSRAHAVVVVAGRGEGNHAVLHLASHHVLYSIEEKMRRRIFVATRWPGEEVLSE